MPIKLPSKVKSLDELPEAIREIAHEFYVEKDGAFTLYTEADPKLNEFRDNNRNLNNRVQELEGKLKTYGELSPEQVKELQDLRQRMEADEDMKLIKDGKFNEVLQKHTERMRTSHQTTLKQVQDQLEAEKQRAGGAIGQLSKLRIDQMLTDKITSIAAPKQGALEDILRRGREKFKLDDDLETVTLVNENDLDDDNKPYTPESWAKHLVNSAEFLFESSKGGGSKGSTGRNTGGVKWIDGTPEEMGKYSDDIIKGKVKVRGMDQA